MKLVFVLTDSGRKWHIACQIGREDRGFKNPTNQIYMGLCKTTNIWNNQWVVVCDSIKEIRHLKDAKKPSPSSKYFKQWLRGHSNLLGRNGYIPTQVCRACLRELEDIRNYYDKMFIEAI